MDWNTWGPAVLSSFVVTILTLAGGYFLKAIIEQGVKYGFDRQIEELKSSLRQSENELATMRSTMLARITASNQEVDKRRLKALETLWSAVVFQNRFSMAIAFAKVINLDAVAAAMQKDNSDARAIKQMAGMIWSVQGYEKLAESALTDISSERLFVPVKSWLAYQAIANMVTRASFLMAAMKEGLDFKGLIKGPEDINGMIISVLPHAADYLKDFPETGGYYLIPQLEEAAFSDITAAISGASYDMDMAARIAMVMEQTRQMEENRLPEKIPEELSVTTPAPPMLLP